ncbi:MAG: xanthine dehydrogenase family protein molybdopterin-binding subunit [Caldilineaceae bacterium]|nr:xanthine dehydrogenase family protein molybdopterin-binding subunit [Caldilineaceae bacterium]
MPIQHIATLRDGSSEDDKLKVVESRGLPAWEADAKFSVIGQRQTRIEGAEKVTGRAQYSYDIQLPGQLYARVLRSPYPHARITSIDASQAEALHGVHAVLTLANSPDIEWYEEKCKLFDATVRLVGDEVAAVAAESEEIADDALRLIQVTYEPLPFVINMEDALRPGAPLVHPDNEYGNMTDEPKRYERGDVDAGLREADVVIDQTYFTETALHNSLEPHGCTAHWHGNQLTLWESTQGIFEVREQVAEKLGLPEHHVRVIKYHMGGGFGAKQVPWKQAVIAALLSKRSGRPVQLMLDREAENLAAGNRNATIQRVRLGAKRDGTLTAIVTENKQAVGAYRVGGEGSNVSGPYERLYRCPNVRTEQMGVYINAGPSVAFRAPGFVEGAFALESAMDELARALEMDPLQLRLQNYTEKDQKKGMPYSSPTGLRACYEQAAAEFGWDAARQSRQQSSGQSSTKRRGIGFAAHDWGGAGHPPGYAWIKLNGDGTADVVTGTQDIGTGTRTGLTQIAAEELGMPISQITLHLGDTAQGPYSPTSAGSATQATIGPAIREAAANVRQQLLDAAALVLEEPVERLIVREGKVLVKDEPEQSVTIAEITGRMAPHMIQGHGAREANPKDKSVRTFGAHCVEVEVDIETGEITVLRLVASHDCGRIINPTMVDSQVIGAVTQGIGYALIEERIVDRERGMVLNANLEEYKVPTVADIPEIIHAQVNLPDLAANSTGAKGIGEPPLIPTAPAIANAVYDAVGVRLRHSPLTRSRLLAALAERMAQDQTDRHSTNENPANRQGGPA